MDSNGDIKLRRSIQKQRDSKVGTHTPIISTQLHRTSFVVYSICITHNIFGIIAPIPSVCQHQIPNIRMFLFGLTKLSIIWFQIERLQLCFIAFDHSSHQLPNNSPRMSNKISGSSNHSDISDNNKFFQSFGFSNTFFIVFRVITFVVTIYVALFTIVGLETRVTKNYGCRELYDPLLASIGLIMVLLLDWFVLYLYISQIYKLSNNLKRYNQTASVQRLQYILTKILFLSIIMEIPFVLCAFSIFSLDILKLIGIIFSAADGVANIACLSLMLEYNKDKYDKFLKFVNKTCCCNVVCVNASENGDSINGDNIDENRNDRMRTTVTTVTTCNDELNETTVGVNRDTIIKAATMTVASKQSVDHVEQFAQV